MKKLWPRVFFAVILASTLLSGVTAGISGRNPGTHPVGIALAAEEVRAPDQATTRYLPVVTRNFPDFSYFGVEVESISTWGGYDEMKAAGADWIRRNALLWSAVEPTQGARNWSAVASLESELANAASAGKKVILIIRSTPAWAQAKAGYTCGPIRSEALAAFAAFMRDVVARYSAAPYNVQYFEMWNEPDIDPRYAQPNSPYGCWGNTGDANYGGGYYGEMLKMVYPQVKAANGAAQVLVGGLLLDCNPNLAKACADDKPPRFLQGILSAGAGGSFDGISFHAYDYYNGVPGQYNNANWGAAWNGSGPVLLAKAQYLRSVLAANNVIGKYLLNTESAVLSGDTCDAACEQSKAYYVAEVYGASLVAGLKANIWFNAFGWRGSGMLALDRTPKPAYNAYAFARKQLGQAISAREITSYPGVRVYAVNRDDSSVWLIWSLDGAAHTINLPTPPSAMWRWDGTSNSYQNAPLSTSVEVNAAPIYVEFGG